MGGARRNIVLVGLMGSGKTTIARLVAERLGRGFVDTDEMVERAAGKPVRQVFDDDGEPAFRRLEAAAVRRAAAGRGQVIAVGGGAVCDPASTARLRESGEVILLDAAPEVLARRASMTPGARPLLADQADVAQRLERLSAERADAYAAASDYVIDTDARTPEEVAAAVIDWLRGREGARAEAEGGG